MAERTVRNVSVNASFSETAPRRGFEGSIPVKSSDDCSMLAPSNGCTLKNSISPGIYDPVSSISITIVANSSRASVLGLNPPVSRSMTTGRKPRNRSTIVFFCTCNLSSCYCPVHQFASSDWDETVIAESVIRRNFPRFF